MLFNMVSILLWIGPDRYLWSGESREHDPRRAAIACSLESLNVDEDVADVACALRSKAEVGPSARTQKGALLERWLAQCGVTSSTIHDRVIARIRR
jgi:hypothetical protein